MTLLVLSLVGFLLGLWLREEWERWQDWRLSQATPLPHIADMTAPTAADVTAGTVSFIVGPPVRGAE